MKKLYLILTLLITFFSFTLSWEAITNITINNNTIIPTFNKETKVYNVFVSSTTEIITINITKEDNEIVTGGGSISLKKGLNIIEIISYVDEIAIEKYTINITRGEYTQDKKDATLRTLTVSGYDIDFDSNTFSYEIDTNMASKLDITYEATNTNSKVKLKGDVDLEKEENIIEITVTSEDKKTSNTYTIKINKPLEEISKIENKESIFDNKEFTPFELKLIIIGIIACILIILGIIFYLLFIKTKYNYKIKYKPLLHLKLIRKRIQHI